MERAKGVEPSSPAWEAGVMPLYDARTGAGHSKPERLRASMLGDPAVTRECNALFANGIAAFIAVGFRMPWPVSTMTP